MAPRPDLAIESRRVLRQDGLVPAAVLIADGRIESVVSPDEVPAGCQRRSFGRSVVMPGLVDSHVHVNEPGRTEWEGFATATRAAAAGGVTTIVDMPLNSVPATTTCRALLAKQDAARGKLFVDCGLWGGVVPGNVDELPGMLAAGACGFKAFLVPSGVDEFPHVGEAELRRALSVIAPRGVPLLAHAELALDVPAGAGDPRRYATYLETRPPSWETEAVRLLIRLAAETGGAVHVVHLSAAEALADLASARKSGLHVTVETCPHYLALRAEQVPPGRTEFKCSPPIRGGENRERLWDGLREGSIDMVVSDHSPCVPERKGLEAGDFLTAWGGIASLELRLPVVWTEARRRGFAVADLAPWLCERPAALAGFDRRKGRLEPGFDADLVVWNPEAAFEVRPELLHHRHQLTPYAGLRLEGVVEAAFVRGQPVFEQGQFPSGAAGEILRRAVVPCG
jgi:allantoinase